MNRDSLTLALIHEVFRGGDASARLRARLADAGAQGAALAVLPELPLHPWVPISREPREEDTEPPGGPRHSTLSEASRATGVAVLGGTIVTRPEDGRRLNRALLYDACGELAASYDKLHIPSEEGFWEADHYGVGDELPEPIDGFGLRLGIQLCSDLFRPQGCQFLGASGAEVILAPRATQATTFDRWRAMIVANAITSRAFLVSVNRPGPEGEPSIGGPCLVVSPTGRVIVETTDPLRVVTLERAELDLAAEGYPGYLPVRSGLYARGWKRASERER